MNTIEQWTAEAAVIAQEVRNTFGHLHVDQLNWKPEPAKWSVGQCIDHLITTNTTYFPILNSIITRTKRTTFWEMVPYLPTFFGKALIKSFQPEAQNKLQSPKVFKPSTSTIRASIIEDFANHQQELIEWIEKTENVDHRKVIITSPASPLVIYSLGDAFTIMLVHERRHIEQAKRVMQQEHFPQDNTLSDE
jgi:hypothetical protein